MLLLLYGDDVDDADDVVVTSFAAVSCVYILHSVLFQLQIQVQSK
jgi:hypothetical protein